jgi:predicted nucleic acid-binding protein
MALMAIAAGSRVYLDANAVIYAIEEPRPPTDGQHDLLAAIDGGEIVAITSELTLAECLVSPFSNNDAKLAEIYCVFLTGTGRLEMWPIDRDILIAAASLRARLGNKLADAIHCATALAGRAGTIVTNDKRFRAPDSMRIALWDEL